MDTLSEIVRSIEETKVFAFDVEAESTTSVSKDATNPRLARITYFSIATKGRSGCFTATPEHIAVIVGLLKRTDLTCIVHYWPYDSQAVHYNGWLDFNEIVCNKIDTALLSWLINEENKPHGLKRLVKQIFGHEMVTYKEVTKTSPTLQSIALCKQKIAQLPELIEKWDKKRPYPTFDDTPRSKTIIRKILRESGVTDRKVLKATADAAFAQDQKDAFIAWTNEERGKLETRLSQLIPISEREFREYSRDDAVWLLRLYGRLIRKVVKSVSKRWIELEMYVKMVSIKMQIHGIRVDTEELDKLKLYMEPLIQEFLGTVYNIAQQEINLNSPQAVQELLFKTMAIPPPIFREDEMGNKWPKLTPEGNRYCEDNGIIIDLRRPETITEEVFQWLSSDKEVLERLNHPIGQAILNYRSVAKLYDTYVLGVSANLEKTGDGRLHAVFNSNGTDTGRFASSDPNLQNIPSRAKESTYDERIQKLGMMLRRTFVAPLPDALAPEGYDLVITDQSQIELRVMAVVTQDYNLLKIYTKSKVHDGTRFYLGDIHLNTQTKLKIQRKLAKNVNFGFNYGMRGEKFARQVKLYKEGTNEYDVDKAEKIRDEFFQEYPGILSLMQALAKEFRYRGRKNYRTLSGRYRHFIDEKVSGGKILNAIIQGSCADLLKVCMFIIDKYICPAYPGTYIALQIHDELVVVSPSRFSEEVSILVKYVMEYPWFDVNVPLLASGRICKKWSDNGNEHIPEVGTLYVEVNGEPRTFNTANWAEWLAIQENKTNKITNKSACAQLTEDQKNWCKRLIPDNGPIIGNANTTRIMTKQEIEALKNGA